MNRIFVCALIITRNRTDWLDRCIRSLALARDRGAEIDLRIRVLVNGQDPTTLSRLELLRGELGDLLGFQLAEEPCSPAKARNVLLASTDFVQGWIYFIDDDAYVPADHFVKFRAAVAEFPDAVAIGGPNLLPERSDRFQMASDVVFTSRLGTYLSNVRYFPKGRGNRRCSEEALILCNLFVLRDALGTEPFPERFVCAEENSLLHALDAGGRLLVYCPELYNWHERRGSLRKLFEQAFNYGRGRGQFIHRHPDGFQATHLVPGMAILYSLYALARVAVTGAVPGLWLALFITYVSACVLTVAAGTGKPRWSVALFPVVHCGYGIGLFYGLLFERDRGTSA